VPAVLIVDDDADHRELLTMLLERHGYQVVAAHDTVTARDLIEAGGVDAALFDVRMPGESGIDLCAALRAEPATVHLPIMLVSADAGDERITAGLASGADDYLIKPFPRAELIVRLDSMINRASKIAATHAAQLAAIAATRLLPEPTPAAIPARLTA
jgi:DNA-binding response OmpR family regulator